MNNLDRRIERLEKMARVKQGPRLIYIGPNLEDGEGEETPYMVKISSELWAHVFGAPLSVEEIRKLREERKTEG